MTDTHAVQLFDTPHTQLPTDLADQRAQIQIDLARCNFLTLHAALAAGEEPTGHRFEQWPPGIQNRFIKILGDWQQRNETAEIRAITQAVQDRVCVLAIHWRMKP